MANLSQREQVFFSYSHKDKKWLELFQASLKPLIRANQISVWDDTKIKAGDIWRDEIKQALASAKVAVLLVSMNFLNSDFIAENELPPLLEAAQKEGLKILMVIVGHSLFDETELGRYQAVNDPSRPLASITAASREKELVRICKEIKATVLGESSKAANPTLETKRPLQGKGADRKLLDELRKVLPSNGSINFIRDFNMAGFAFEIRRLDDLYDFLHRWNDVEHEFLDEDLEEKRRHLYVLINEYATLIGYETFRLKEDLQSVPSEWEYEQPERFTRTVNQLHDKAGEVVKAYDDLIRAARHKLEG